MTPCGLHEYPRRVQRCRICDALLTELRRERDEARAEKAKPREQRLRESRARQLASKRIGALEKRTRQRWEK